MTEAIVSEKPVREIATYVIRGFMQMAVDQVVHREGGEDEHHRIVMSDDLQGLPGMPELGSQPLGSMFAAPGLSEQGIPDSMFVDLVGLDHQRSVVLTCLQSQGTLHCLLYGPPGTGKSAITDEVAKIPGAESMTGANTTGPGLASVLLQEPAPPVVIIEEVDNLNPSGYGTLQRAMDGVVTRTRDQGHEERQYPHRLSDDRQPAGAHPPPHPPPHGGAGGARPQRRAAQGGHPQLPQARGHRGQDRRGDFHQGGRRLG